MTGRLIATDFARFTVVDDKDTFWDRVVAGNWEPQTLAALAEAVDGDCVFVDIGAWIGPLTLLAAARGARVVAFEPDPRAFTLLSDNVAANPDLAGRIALHNRAIAPTAGRLRFGSPRKPGDSMGSVLAAATADITWEADALTPVDAAALAGAADRRVVKMDIEGAEYDLLPVAAPLLDNPTDTAIIAYHPRLLVGAGRSAGEITAATARAEEALAGFVAGNLDDHGPDGHYTRNSTVLYSRR